MLQFIAANGSLQVLQCTLLGDIVHKNVVQKNEARWSCTLHKLHSYMEWAFLLMNDYWEETMTFKIELCPNMEWYNGRIKKISLVKLSALKYLVSCSHFSPYFNTWFYGATYTFSGDTMASCFRRMLPPFSHKEQQKRLD